MVVLLAGRGADDDVAGVLDDDDVVVTGDEPNDTEPAGVDGSPAPVPCPGEDVLQAASTSASMIAKL